MITLTEVAAREVSQIIKKQQEAAQKNGSEPAKMYLRVGVKGGGCSGFSYTLDLTETISEQDETFNQHGIEVVCDPKSLLYLEGTQVDFKITQFINLDQRRRANLLVKKYFDVYTGESVAHWHLTLKKAIP